MNQLNLPSHLIKYFFILLYICCTSSFAASEERYLCATEEASGYDYKNGRWIRERFPPDDRFMVTHQNGSWTVHEYEVDQTYEDCELFRDDVDTLICSVTGDFTMNMKTKKFSVTNTDPFVNSTKRNRDSVTLKLGSCVPM